MMQLDVGEIRKWLMRSPRPHLVRVHIEDDAHDLQIDQSVVRWADLAKTICELDPRRIEIYDGQLNLVRAEKIAGAPQVSSEEETETEAPPSPVQAFGAPLPPIPIPVAGDPLMQLYMFFAAQLKQAYEHSYGHSTNVAFTKMVEVYTVVTNQMRAFERRLENTEKERWAMMTSELEEQRQKAAELEEILEELRAKGGAEGNGLLDGIMAGMNMAGGEPPAANGKGKAS